MRWWVSLSILRWFRFIVSHIVFSKPLLLPLITLHEPTYIARQSDHGVFLSWKWLTHYKWSGYLQIVIPYCSLLAVVVLDNLMWCKAVWSLDNSFAISTILPAFRALSWIGTLGTGTGFSIEKFIYSEWMPCGWWTISDDAFGKLQFVFSRT